MITLARILLRSLIGKPRAQLVVGIIVTLFALFVLFVDIATPPVSGTGIVAGLIFAVVGILLIVQGIRHLGSTKKPASYTASYMPPQTPYAQPAPNQMAYPAQPPYAPQPAPYAAQPVNEPLRYQDQ